MSLSTTLHRTAALSLFLAMPFSASAGSLLGGGGGLLDADVSVSIGGGSLADVDADVSVGGGSLADVDAKASVGGGSVASVDVGASALGGGSGGSSRGLVDANVNVDVLDGGIGGGSGGSGGSGGGLAGNGGNGGGGFGSGGSGNACCMVPGSENWSARERAAFDGMTLRQRNVYLAAVQKYVGKMLMSSDREALGIVREVVPTGNGQTLFRVQVNQRLGVPVHFARMLLGEPRVAGDRVWIGMTENAFVRHLTS